MNENERSIVKTPSITKQAKTFNSIDIHNTIQGMRTAAYMERKTRESEIEQIKASKNQTVEEIPVPSGSDIRAAREEGEYR